MDVLPGDNQKEKGRVNAPVIRELPVRKLGLGGRVEPVFMQDLAWLLLRFRIDTTPLIGREGAQRRGCNRGVDGKHLPGRDERIASKQRVVPRGSGEQVSLGCLQSIEVLPQRSPDRLRVNLGRPNNQAVSYALPGEMRICLSGSISLGILPEGSGTRCWARRSGPASPA